MSITSEISRLTTLRNTLRTKAIALGLISDSSADFDDCVTAINGITAKAAATYNTSATDQTISASQFLTGTQTIRAVTTTNLSAGNVKYNTVVQVGDSADSDRVTSVTGTFTSSSTVSTGQTAATAGEILTGYSAWVDGAEVQGSLRAMTTAEILAAVQAGWAS